VINRLTFNFITGEEDYFANHSLNSSRLLDDKLLSSQGNDVFFILWDLFLGLAGSKTKYQYEDY